MPTGEADARRIFQLATRGTNVHYIGPRLSGRSTTLAEVEREYASGGYATVVVRGVGDQLPLAAVRAAVADALELAGPGTPSPSRLASVLAERRPSAIIVDDADRLDAASWEVLALAHRLGRIPLVVATALGGPGAERRPLLRLSPPARLRVEPLSLDDVQDQLEHRLGGLVSPSLTSRLHTKSGGRIGVVAAIADAGVGSGRIRRTDAGWSDAPDLWSPDLETVYESLLAECDDDLAEALEALALAGVTELRTAARLIGADRIEQLESRALVRTLPLRSQLMVSVEPPGLTDYFLHQRSSARRHRILGSIAAATADDAPSADAGEPLELAPLRGVTAPAGPGADLPQLAHMFSDSFAAASATATAEWRRSRSVGAAVRVLNLQLSGRPTRGLADAVLAGTPFDNGDETEELILRRLHERWLRASGADLDAGTDALLHGVERDFGHRTALDALVIAARMETSGIRSGDVEALRALAAEGASTGVEPAEPAADDLGRAVARLVLAFALVLAGEGDEALAVLDRVAAATNEAVGVHRDYARGLALYASGRLEEAAAWAGEHLERCLAEVDRAGLVAHAYVAVVSLAGLGRFEEAFATAQLVLGTGVGAAHLLFAPDRAVLVLLAFVAVRTGRRSAAHSLRERAATLRGRSDGIPFGTPDLIDAAVLSAEGTGEEAAERYRRLADELHGRGYRLAGDTLTMLASLAHFDPEAALGEAAGGVASGDLYRAWVAGQVALQGDDPEALVAASRVLRRFGARDEALKLLSQAARSYRDREDDAAGERTQDEIRRLFDDSVRETDDPTQELGLTAREAEIVQGIADGLSNVELAARLGVSVRTIDSHLRNIRQKTGTIERDDLARIGGRGTA